MAAKYKQMLFEQTDQNEEMPVTASETVYPHTFFVEDRHDK
jgi:hypothetical protein